MLFVLFLYHQTNHTGQTLWEICSFIIDPKNHFFNAHSLFDIGALKKY